MADISFASAKKRGISLPQIQTSFNDSPHNRLQRPRPVETLILEKGKNDARPDKISAPHNCQPQKGTLCEFFGWGRSATVRKANQTHDICWAENGRTVQPKIKISSASSQESHEYPLANGIHGQCPTSNSPPSSLQPNVSKRASKLKSDRPEVAVKSLGSWEPPELFKAYPQAVRHVRLRAPLLRPERILHYFTETENRQTKEDGTKGSPDQDANILGGCASKTRKEREKKTKRSIQDIWSNVNWTEKIYVLATSGYLLQYSGSGSFDRVPEKYISLGKHSAAFVSDAIPGQHYVLQVSRVAQEDGTIPSETPRSIFKRLGFRKDSRRFASNLLLVFDAPGDMNEWLVTLRKEIESLGGRKYLPDVICQPSEDAAKRILEKPSRQYLIKRDPDQFADSELDSDSGAGVDRNRLSASDPIGCQVNNVKPSSSLRRKSLDSPSLSYITTSTDQIYLDQLRGTPRLSYASAGAKTLSTSWSSPSPSPARAAFASEEPTTKPEGHEITNCEVFRLDQSSTNSRSAKALLSPSAPVSGMMQTRNQRRLSSCSSSSEQIASWLPPNYSVPNFSKRYSYSTNASTVSTPSGPLSDSGKKHMPSTSSQQEKCAGSQNSSPPLPPLGDSSVFYPTLAGAIPRHFSSPASYRGDSPCQQPEIEETSPHPPPTTALPALPEHRMARKLSRSVHDSHRPERAVSVQGRSHPDSWPRSIISRIGAHDPSEVDEYTISSPSRTGPVRKSPPRVALMQPGLQHPKSMPQLLSTGSVEPSPADLSVLSDVPLVWKTAGHVKDLTAATHHDSSGRRGV